MLIKTLPVGQLETNCYIVTNENTLECVVIDPGDESCTIMNYIEENKLKCRAIMITHGHFDHVGALEAVMGETGAPVYINERDAKNFQGFVNYEDGDEIELAGLKFKILATPGHTPGGVTIIVEDAMFTGDTLFRGSCGRTDLPGGNVEDLMRSLKKICLVEGEYEVYPGHMDSSLLIRERDFNFYCRKAMQDY